MKNEIIKSSDMGSHIEAVECYIEGKIVECLFGLEGKVTWKAFSGQPQKNLVRSPALTARGGLRDTVGAGSQTSMKSAIMAIICVSFNKNNNNKTKLKPHFKTIKNNYN